MINWNSAIADLLDADEDFQCIYINSREDLGHSFDKDEVVVNITKVGVCWFFTCFLDPNQGLEPFNSRIIYKSVMSFGKHISFYFHKQKFS